MFHKKSAGVTTIALTRAGAMMAVVIVMMMLAAGGAYAQGRAAATVSTYQDIRPFLLVGYAHEFNQNRLRQRSRISFGEGSNRVVFATTAAREGGYYLEPAPISITVFDVRRENSGEYVVQDEIFRADIVFQNTYVEWATNAVANRAVVVRQGQQYHGQEVQSHSFVFVHNPNSANGTLELVGAEVVDRRAAHLNNNNVAPGVTELARGWTLIFDNDIISIEHERRNVLHAKRHPHLRMITVSYDKTKIAYSDEFGRPRIFDTASRRNMLAEHSDFKVDTVDLTMNEIVADDALWLDNEILLLRKDDGRAPGGDIYYFNVSNNASGKLTSSDWRISSMIHRGDRIEIGVTDSHNCNDGQECDAISYNNIVPIGRIRELISRRQELPVETRSGARR